ncbi:hypothetical protein J8I01_02105 [Aeromonas sanarellii]|uniref:PIN like domain-containing protein n=1 Tax=Aeromonas sanarellii TaxID=633415 RepID=A0ABS4B1G4_9GAMM|nr:PIN-like domain-containing protein [Aeromonas sanarellii]MBP0601316.1 hypothetical protein [Aeromonas sanarellii]
MRDIFPGYFKPTEEQFVRLWDSCVFSFDANVLLNLYRFSTKTREELLKALNHVSDNSHITHQAAKEFLKNRLGVTSGQASEYNTAIKDIEKLTDAILTKDRHPFLPDEELQNFSNFSVQLIESLKTMQQDLFEKFSNDEILNFVEELFDGKTGRGYDETQIVQLAQDGEIRYNNEIPPGYKDGKKDQTGDPYRKFGDLIVWKQLIDESKNTNKPIVFITDDKKEDWWLQQSGRTIGPRPELIEEFYKETNQQFWMYTVDKFVQEVAKKNESSVSDEVIDEIQSIDNFNWEELLKEFDVEWTRSIDIPAISVTQEIQHVDDQVQSGLFTVTLNKNMKFATGTGKFKPFFEDVPDLEVELVDSPYSSEDPFKLSYGCGTVKNFNVHLRGYGENLEQGDYIFRYKAYLTS